MTIVLNEHEWAEDMIQNHSLGKKPFETLSRVAKYYLDKNYQKKDVRGMLDTFILQCDPTASLPKWSQTVDYALIRASKYKAIQIDSIGITKNELDIINGLEGAQIKRLAFTLLCLSKYWLAVNPNSDYWVNNKDNEIMKMANVNTSIKRQGLMYHKLNELGLIQFSKKIDNTNVRVCFVSDDETILQISDFRNLGYQYLYFNGDKNYYQCQNCGITVRKNKPITEGQKNKGGHPQKYCKDCASEIKLQKNVDAVMRYRNTQSKVK